MQNFTLYSSTFPKIPPKICNSNNWSFCGIHIMEMISVKATVEWKHGFRETLKIYFFLNQEWLGTRRVETSQRNLTSCLHRSKVGLTQYDSVSYFKQSYGCSEYWVCIKYTQQAACTPSTHLLTFFLNNLAGKELLVFPYKMFNFLYHCNSKPPSYHTTSTIVYTVTSWTLLIIFFFFSLYCNKFIGYLAIF